MATTPSSKRNGMLLQQPARSPPYRSRTRRRAKPDGTPEGTVEASNWGTARVRHFAEAAGPAAVQHVENASYCLYLAFDKANVQDFEPSPSRNVIAHADGIHAWYSTLVNSTFHRYRELRKALLYPWTPPAEVEPLTRLAFRLLSEITPADSQLRQLYKHDRSRALQELPRQLDGVADVAFT